MTVSRNMKESKSRAMKNAWESELGYGWSRSGERRCRLHRPPESTMSVGSDIRFTRRKLSRPCRGCCAALAALLVLLLLATVALYLGHMYLFGDPLHRQTFRGSFVVSSWTNDNNSTEKSVIDSGAREQELSRALASMYRQSPLRSCFVGADILALDNADEGMRVHFEVSFEPIFTAVSIEEVRNVLVLNLQTLATGTTVPGSLHIEENKMLLSQALEDPDLTAEEAVTTESTTQIVEETRECAEVSLPLCSHLSYNQTSYPNLAGHVSRDALYRDLVAFRELLDAECSHLAQDFVCQMLQPRCVDGRLIRPCRAYCRAFHSGCGARLPERLKPFFDCSRFPDYFGIGSCYPQPDCQGTLQRVALSRRSCDGVPDCADAGDERDCSHCSLSAAQSVRCALSTRCLPPHLRCDGTPDCPDGSDEAGCLWISRSLSGWLQQSAEATLGAVRSRAGYALWAERGRAGKLCAGNRTPRALASVAASLCKELTFSGTSFAEIVVDSEANENTTETPHYVEVADPNAPELSFLKTECLDRRVVRVVCGELECGVASARVGMSRSGVSGLRRSALPGDWPWHAALFRAHVHSCDATLVHTSWLLTTASCFQGQPKAEWTARMGTVRIQSTTPWQQERRIVGMIRSPVEGSTLALVRLEDPIETTDFVRPVCLPPASSAAVTSVCNTLGWARNLDQLQRVHISAAPMNHCENASIATVNGLCAEPLYDQDDCDEEEYAGSAMMCFDEVSKSWALTGVSSWRIACTKIGIGRPRIYDAVSSHVEWIKRTIADSVR